MSLDAQELAKKLHDTLSQKADGHGVPIPISSQTLNRAKGIIAALNAASVSHASGTITGVTAPASPLSGGAATGGVIAMTSAPMRALITQGIPPGALADSGAECDALIAYIATGTVTFASGGITGTCTNTPSAPGPLTLGTGVSGTLTGITGAGALAAIGSRGPDGAAHYNALIGYILANAVVTYAPGSVTGTCPSGGGPLTLGTGVGGTIS